MLVTRGYGVNQLIVTRGFGTTVVVIRREVLRLKSYLKMLLRLESVLWRQSV